MKHASIPPPPISDDLRRRLTRSYATGMGARPARIATEALFDGIPSERCLALFTGAQRSDVGHPLTPVQLAEARRAWSTLLAQKVDASARASAEKERLRVVNEQDVDE